MTVSGGEELRDQALSDVERNADVTWLDKARLVVEELAATGQPFSPDDIWATGLERPHEPRALGPVMMRAARRGLIEPTGAWIKSKQKSQHATPIRVWRGKAAAARLGSNPLDEAVELLRDAVKWDEALDDDTPPEERVIPEWRRRAYEILG